MGEVRPRPRGRGATEGTRHGTRGHPRPTHLSTCDTKRVSKAPRVRSCSEASPWKSRSWSTSLSSTSRTSSPMYLPPMSFSYLTTGARHRAGRPRQQAEPVATSGPVRQCDTPLATAGVPSPVPLRPSWARPCAASTQGRPQPCGRGLFLPPTYTWGNQAQTGRCTLECRVGLRASESHPPSRGLCELEMELTQGTRWRLAHGGGPEGTVRCPSSPGSAVLWGRGHVCALGTSGSNPVKVAVGSQSLLVPVGARGPSRPPRPAGGCGRTPACRARMRTAGSACQVLAPRPGSTQALSARPAPSAPPLTAAGPG